MDKNKVLEVFYNTVKNSCEWSNDSKDYCNYIDGLVEMTTNILNEFDKKENIKENKS